jgi:TolB protein
MHRQKRTPLLRHAYLCHLGVLLLLLVGASALQAQEGFKTETSSGVSNIRIAVADFKPASADPQTSAFKHTFDSTLFADLSNAGIFDIVSKSLLPQSTPGAPVEISIQQWANAPTSAAMVAFGNFSVQGSRITCNGFLFDAKNIQYPQVLAKQYNEDASDDAARQIAHRFADEIIFRLSGGSQGIAESKIFYVKLTGSDKEIWQMDYDGANQHPHWAATASRSACSLSSSTAW